MEGRGDVRGEDPFGVDEIPARLEPREWAARSALDVALHDLQGKLAGVAVWRLLGLRRGGPPTSWTIWLGDPDDMAPRAGTAPRRVKRLERQLRPAGRAEPGGGGPGRAGADRAPQAGRD